MTHRPTQIIFALPHTSPNLAHKSLKWLVIGTSTLSLAGFVIMLVSPNFYLLLPSPHIQLHPSTIHFHLGFCESLYFTHLIIMNCVYKVQLLHPCERINRVNYSSLQSATWERRGFSPWPEPSPGYRPKRHCSSVCNRFPRPLSDFFLPSKLFLGGNALLPCATFEQIHSCHFGWFNHTNPKFVWSLRSYMALNALGVKFLSTINHIMHSSANLGGSHPLMFCNHVR